MSRTRLSVVLSQAPGKHPAKRALEEDLAAGLLMEPGLDTAIIPNLYDLGPDHTGRIFLGGLHGDLVVLSWHYPRASFWLLDRIGVKGHFGETQITQDDTEEEKHEELPSGIGSSGTIPDRWIYCLDLRHSNSPETFIAEIRRIARECSTRKDQKTGATPTMVDLGLPLKKELPQPSNSSPQQPFLQSFTPEQLLESPNRRWYPVIDYSRCTNCLECLDFCLFGVYGIDHFDRILVESQDSCKKGCPACSRVCPEQAIIFPEYKTAAIAGAPVGDISGLKIDLSRLFGGDTKDALTVAVQERDRELVADGRAAVGTSVGIPKRQADRDTTQKDDLDKLMDDLDSLGL